ncbi:MAG: AAA family ATPase, partial [Solirubrobacteraceae bacterium]
MFLKSLELKGFKSFPDRTLLSFDEGVSVVVGPNGCGKSNITDAVLWCLGEQSPLAVRGQSMQDVIFSGGHGVQARREAVVELVLDNSDGAIDLPASELSIVRRLDRSGEGEYRMNGARCRLVDVLEVLSDTGMGKEAHSVISQGRVESIVMSKPRERRMLIEEAAGLGKHRKRRRRAQLKLERTQENLDRALDVEREARVRLRPLKRQAEAAEAHERLERQSLEARWELARDALRDAEGTLVEAEGAVAAVRAARALVERALAEVAARREAASQALAARGEVREELSRGLFAVRSARERIALRLEGVRACAETLRERSRRRGGELLDARTAAAADGPVSGERIAELEGELAQLDEDRERGFASELAELDAGRARALAAVEVRGAEREATAAQCAQAEGAAAEARAARREAERALESARRESARVGGELAAVNQFLRSAAGASAAGALEHALHVRPGYETALAAALGELLGAAVVADRAAAEMLLDRSGAEGGRVLVGRGGAEGAEMLGPPCAGSEPMQDVVSAAGEPAAELAARLLRGVWIVPALELVPAHFAGIAVTRSGRVWHAAVGELRQLPSGGRQRALEQRNRREALILEASAAAAAEHSAAGALATCEEIAAAGEGARERAELAVRDAGRAHDEAVEAERRARWLIDERRRAPDQGASAVRAAQLAGELAAERRAAERAERERLAREQRIDLLAGQIARDEALLPRAEALAEALRRAGAAVEQRVEQAERALSLDAQAGAGVAEELRSCAAQEAEIQLQLRADGEAVTSAEVQAQQARDACAEAGVDVAELAGRLGLAAEPAVQALEEEVRSGLVKRVELLARRREQIGPVNPLAADEHGEGLERVEEIEAQRCDL